MNIRGGEGQPGVVDMPTASEAARNIRSIVEHAKDNGTPGAVRNPVGPSFYPGFAISGKVRIRTRGRKPYGKVPLNLLGGPYQRIIQIPQRFQTLQILIIAPEVGNLPLGFRGKLDQALSPIVQPE
jgi:hypothetical protein